MYPDLDVDNYFCMDICCQMEYNFRIIDRCTQLQERTPFCKNKELTIIWHFRKFLPYIGMWIAAYGILLLLLSR